MQIKVSIAAALLAAAPAFAETVAPFPADDCNPGYTASGEFVDGANRILQQTGWVAKATNVVVTADGRRVFLTEDCLAAYLAERDNSPEVNQNGGTGLANGGIGAALVAALLAGLAGGGSSNTTTTTN